MLTDDELIAWRGDELPPPLEAIRLRIAQEPPWQKITVLQGWWPILRRLDERLRELDPDYRLAEIKQKFAQLNVYPARPAAREVLAAIEEAQDESRTTCEVCAQPGARRTTTSGWWSVLCENHKDFDDEYLT